MIICKTPREIEIMREAGRIVALAHHEVQKHIKPGVTTKHLDKIVEDVIRSQGAIPSFKGYHGFPASICASVNDELVHGIPGNRVLKEGDIISTDINAGKLELEVSDEELEGRRKRLKPVEPKVTEGYLARYAKLVSSASTGAVFK